MSGREKQPGRKLPSNAGKVASAQSSQDVSVTGGQTTVNKLTPEEQMALFEKELKENDWGHQPC